MFQTLVLLRFHCHAVGISYQNWVSPEQRRGRGHSIDGLNGVHSPGSTLENEDWIRSYNGSRKNTEKIGFSFSLWKRDKIASNSVKNHSSVYLLEYIKATDTKKPLKRVDVSALLTWLRGFNIVRLGYSECRYFTEIS